MPVVLGAVYSPDDEIVPPVADQVTPVLLLPLTLAENCCVFPSSKEIAEGLTEIEITGAVTVTVAVADFVLSAELVAVTL